MDRLLLRAMSADDVPAINAIALREGRNLHERELARFLALEGAGGLVAAQEDRVVGAVTTMRYFEHGFIGPVVLDGGADAVGVAVALAVGAVESLQSDGVATIDAECAPAEESVLARMGFRVVRRTLILERPASKAEPPPRTVPLERAHFLDLGALDAAAVGWGRKEFLWELREEFPQGARALESHEGLRGYVLLRRSRRGYHLGPLVTAPGDEEAARLLLVDAVAAGSTWPIVALVPEQSPLAEAMRPEGFEPVGTLARMRAGAAPSPADAAGATEWLLGGRLTG